MSRSPTRTPPSDDDDRHKKRSRGVHAVKGKDKDATPQLSPSELRDLLAQATKGIAALAAQSGEADHDGSDAGKLSSPKKNPGAKGSGKGKYRRYTGRKQDPKVDPCRNCNEMGHWAKDCPKPCLLYTSDAADE